MRQSLSLALGLLLTTGLLLAQDHNNATEKIAKSDVTFTSDIRVGTQTLKAGDYKVVCDSKMVTFSRIDHPAAGDTSGRDKIVKVLEAPCKGKELKSAAESTLVQTNVDKSGVRYLETLLLKGSTIEHVFD